ncbi:MAG TPA: molybdenum cofactor biosynthesis protein MoaE, partial [bacterium]|nr:molybdenum cofactor biosynthesis protein MoaE [bacterium]
MATCHCALTDQPIDLPALLPLLDDPGTGGHCWFFGSVRDANHGFPVTALEYEAYAPMAVKLLEVLARHLEHKYGCRRVVLVHRLGRLRVGEVAVVVGVSAAHRDEAFRACREGIDRLKLEVPIWKKEYFAGGQRWVDNCEGCLASAEEY